MTCHEQHDFRMNVFNPRVVEIADEMKAYKEDCLTWPFLMLSIRRPIDCVVNYWNEENDEVRKTARHDCKNILT